MFQSTNQVGYSESLLMEGTRGHITFIQLVPHLIPQSQHYSFKKIHFGLRTGLQLEQRSILGHTSVAQAYHFHVCRQTS